MSGGAFNYREEQVANDFFEGLRIPRYTKDIFSASTEARTKGPFEDRVLNERLWDLLCLIHAYDLYISGDTNENDWGWAKGSFNKKWGMPSKQYQEAFIDIETRKIVDELKNSLLPPKEVEAE